MRRTLTGYLINRNGKPILTLRSTEIAKPQYYGQSFKEHGMYYFYVGIRGKQFIYQA